MPCSTNEVLELIESHHTDGHHTDAYQMHTIHIIQMKENEDKQKIQ